MGLSPTIRVVEQVQSGGGVRLTSRDGDELIGMVVYGFRRVVGESDGGGPMYRRNSPVTARRRFRSNASWTDERRVRYLRLIHLTRYVGGPSRLPVQSSM